MKKFLIFFSLINIIFAQEHLLFFVGQDTHKLIFENSTTDLLLKSTYSAGGELSMDIGQNFEIGVGLEIITLASMEGTKLKLSDRMFPAYFRITAKANENDYLVPYIFGTYGKLVTDFQYTKGTTTVKAMDGVVTMLGIGLKIQKNISVEIYDGTFTNQFELTQGIITEVKDATNKVIGIRVGYFLM